MRADGHVAAGPRLTVALLFRFRMDSLLYRSRGLRFLNAVRSHTRGAPSSAPPVEEENSLARRQHTTRHVTADDSSAAPARFRHGTTYQGRAVGARMEVHPASRSTRQSVAPAGGAPAAGPPRGRQYAGTPVAGTGTGCRVRTVAGRVRTVAGANQCRWQVGSRRRRQLWEV
jgi:hypothetical protein